MSDFDCSRQHELVALVRGGSIDDDVQSHLDSCRECAEVARVIGGLAPLAEASRPVPPFSQVLWQAQARDILGASTRRTDHAVRPLRLFHGAIGIGLVVMALVLAVVPVLVHASADVLMAAPMAVLATAALGGMILVSVTTSPTATGSAD